MKTSDFYYDLPPHLIAQKPLQERTESLLMCVDRSTQSILPTRFKELKQHLRSGDVLVFNDSAVIPARLTGVKSSTQAVIEILLLNEKSDDVWECLVKKARKIDVNDVVSFGEDDLIAHCLEVKNEGLRIFKFTYHGIFLEILSRLGETPLPPYIKERLDDPSRYQTVYAKHPGSVAAPTAGLHFSNAYLEELKDQGILFAYVTLHVGLGTFRPVSVEDVNEHKMHEEWYAVDATNARIIAKAKEEKRRVIAVGTTAMRTLETITQNDKPMQAQSGQSDLFIYPGYTFHCVDGLLTNFHLPESTLMMLVSAFATKALIFEAYQKAIDHEFRFFSFGDAMLIL